MKARIRATNDIYNVIDMNDYRNRIQLEDHNWYTMGEIELIEDNKPDWQHYRIQAAIAAIQGLVSNEIHLNHADKVAEEKGINTSTFLAKCAIDIADALVAELQKKQD